MEHGSEVELLVIIAAGLVVWGLVARRLERWYLTAPMAFVALGLVMVNEPLDIVEVRPGSAVVRLLAELTLALVLFSDAARIRGRALREDLGLPTRLLGIGFPLSVALGVGVAEILFADIDPWVAAVIGAAVAPTDAALGSTVVNDERVPARIRRALNVESGLNDGLATPIVTFCITGAVVEARVAVDESIGDAAVELLVGVGLGLAIGVAGGWLLGRALRGGWGSASFAPIAVLALALLAFAATDLLGGNGFVASFVGGFAFGGAARRSHAPPDALLLVADGGELLSLALWFLFGGLLVGALTDLPWEGVLYAGLALTVVRMLPVALSLVGSRVHAVTALFLGWFGPRGVASVVFALLAFDALPQAEGDLVLGVVTVTVLASVVLHGATSRPFSLRYSRRAEAMTDQHPERRPSAPLTARTIGRGSRWLHHRDPE